MTAFDTKRWLCEDTVRTHSHGHKNTVPNPVDLVNRSFIMDCITDAGVFSRNDLPGTAALRSERADSDWADFSTPEQSDVWDSDTSDWSGYSS